MADLRGIAGELIPVGAIPVTGYLGYELAQSLARPVEGFVEDSFNSVFNSDNKGKTAQEVVEGIESACTGYYSRDDGGVGDIAACMVENGVDLRPKDLGDASLVDNKDEKIDPIRTSNPNDDTEMAILITPNSVKEAVQNAGERAQKPINNPVKVGFAVADVCDDLQGTAQKARCLIEEADVPLGYLISDNPDAVRPVTDSSGVRPDELLIKFDPAAVDAQIQALMSLEGETVVEAGTIAATHIAAPDSLKADIARDSLSPISVTATFVAAAVAAYFGYRGARRLTHQLI